MLVSRSPVLLQTKIFLCESTLNRCRSETPRFLLSVVINGCEGEGGEDCRHEEPGLTQQANAVSQFKHVVAKANAFF